MKAALLLQSAGLLAFTQADAPVEYVRPDPLTVQVTFADPEWVNNECVRRIGHIPDHGMVFEACAGVGDHWMILRHGQFYQNDRMGFVVKHETAHVRGWYHG